ncbi:uncharacterized protein NEMAJ01_0256 [Nematocida major]|uniref:uncharacterized protein n=1 Tax=Nematocida major TaxID=1912982 RepID=UPI0020080EF5|nr:uncharacterized protein NEMAJ01_0256 [Nematocida major]KAH9385360.1 hypothetical protein NEMAJ01_0256 [Nematocida major]
MKWASFLRFLGISSSTGETYPDGNYLSTLNNKEVTIYNTSQPTYRLIYDHHVTGVRLLNLQAIKKNKQHINAIMVLSKTSGENEYKILIKPGSQPASLKNKRQKILCASKSDYMIRACNADTNTSSYTLTWRIKPFVNGYKIKDSDSGSCLVRSTDNGVLKLESCGNSTVEHRFDMIEVADDPYKALYLSPGQLLEYEMRSGGGGNLPSWMTDGSAGADPSESDRNNNRGDGLDGYGNGGYWQNPHGTSPSWDYNRQPWNGPRDPHDGLSGPNNQPWMGGHGNGNGWSNNGNGNGWGNNGNGWNNNGNGHGNGWGNGNGNGWSNNGNGNGNGWGNGNGNGWGHNGNGNGWGNNGNGWGNGNGHGNGWGNGNGNGWSNNGNGHGNGWGSGGGNGNGWGNNGNGGGMNNGPGWGNGLNGLIGGRPGAVGRHVINLRDLGNNIESLKDIVKTLKSFCNETFSELGLCGQTSDSMSNMSPQQLQDMIMKHVQQAGMQGAPGFGDSSYGGRGHMRHDQRRHGPPDDGYHDRGHPHDRDYPERGHYSDRGHPHDRDYPERGHYSDRGHRDRPSRGHMGHGPRRRRSLDDGYPERGYHSDRRRRPQRNEYCIDPEEDRDYPYRSRRPSLKRDKEGRTLECYPVGTSEGRLHRHGEHIPEERRHSRDRYDDYDHAPHPRHREYPGSLTKRHTPYDY